MRLDRVSELKRVLEGEQFKKICQGLGDSSSELLIRDVLDVTEKLVEDLISRGIKSEEEIN